jgi:hypothetical protein
MVSSANNYRGKGDKLQASCVTLGNRWSACVATNDWQGRAFSAEQWTKALSKPESLLENCREVIKSDGVSTVAVQTLNIAGAEVPVVVKYQRTGGGLRSFFRSLLPAKAVLNFRTAATLQEKGIPAVRPLAALQQKRWIFTTASIYITEYAEGATNLHSFLLQQQSKPLANTFDKSSLTDQTIGLLAALHNNGLWHRDAKAGNFLVVPQGDAVKVMLVDMDGIKPYIFRKTDCRFRSLSKIASTLLWCRLLNVTDYLRSLKTYCRLTNLDTRKTQSIFRSLSKKAIAMRLLTMARAAMQNK